jgi:hypothetical protein
MTSTFMNMEPGGMTRLLEGLLGWTRLRISLPWVSVYNYAENEPIRHIDLHGLQKKR